MKVLNKSYRPKYSNKHNLLKSFKIWQWYSKSPLYSTWPPKYKIFSQNEHRNEWNSSFNIVTDIDNFKFYLKIFMGHENSFKNTTIHHKYLIKNSKNNQWSMAKILKEVWKIIKINYFPSLLSCCCPDHRGCLNTFGNLTCFEWNCS